MRLIGQRPKPRVALIGKFSQQEIQSFNKIFPTVWPSQNMTYLLSHKDLKEIDLIIFAEDSYCESSEIYGKFVINFSVKNRSFLSPSVEFHTYLGDLKLTEEGIFPNTLLSYDYLRKNEDWESINGYYPINIHPKSFPIEESKIHYNVETIKDGALVLDTYTTMPLATIFIYTKDNKKFGAAWFAIPVINKVGWVNAIVCEWAKDFPDSFPNINSWANDAGWLLPIENDIVSRISLLNKRKRKLDEIIESELISLHNQLTELKIKNDQNIRTLLTSKGEQLVESVSFVLKDLGFMILDIDETLNDHVPKKEDLRIKTSDTSDWEGIIEVRGYEKSAGKEDDLARLEKFSRLYLKEKNKLPSKQIYIVNGPIELNPPNRPKPFESAKQRVELFSEVDGLIISSIVLYRMYVNSQLGLKDKMRELIVNSVGRLDEQKVVESTK